MQLENLDGVIDFIIDNDLIAKGDRVGVAVSGGSDSMALLTFLESISNQAGFSIVALHINHGIRKGARKDAGFVAKYCKENNIEHISTVVDVPAHAKRHKIGIEQAARELRYEALSEIATRKKLNKIALAHHQADQAETILMHIFRGSGAAGAKGMEPKRGIYIRPFLETPKTDIVAYNYRLQIPYIEDETNQDENYARNFIRHQVMPMIQREWRGVEKNIIDFGKNCRKDEEYISSLVDTNSFNTSENVVRVPLSLFFYHDAVVNRIILAALETLNERENIERKHIKLITTLARTGENGSKTDLPNNLFAVREYEYLSIVKRQPPSVSRVYSFKIGKTNFAEYGIINVSKTISYKDALSRGLMTLDVDSVPRGAKWRTRKDGDTFTKFGGGTKTLNAYLIDIKVPTRLRDKIPVLAHNSEILAIAGIQIADRVKVTPKTLEAYIIETIRE